jgi:aspartyl-tRNA(Asn)/glutamyl-tRNA(Gln) amidotransferase subunit B
MHIKIGLETHIQLNSKSKLFCGCRNPANLEEDPDPNTLTCPTCLGLPGSKPRTNRKVVEMGIRLALALNSRIAGKTYFSRKTYFYPDMSKNFQITQYEVPLASGGFLQTGIKKISISRINVEEDPAKLVHVGGLGGKYVLVDYNRAGIPLLEVVTEPVFASPAEARQYIQKLETILEYLGIYYSYSRAVLKSDANISMEGGARVEIKNITGSRETERALNYEIVRQKNLVSRGTAVKRETRMWNPSLGVTQEMRGKEEEEEYGYIFEPDLTAIEIGMAETEKIRKEMPELPSQKYSRFVRQYKLPEAVAESLTSELDIGNLFEAVSKKVEPRLAGTWIAGVLKKTLNWNNLRYARSGLKDEWITDLLKMFSEGKLTDRNTEIAIRRMAEEKRPPAEIIRKHGLEKREIGNLEDIAEKILACNQKARSDYLSGKKEALNFLVGLAIRETNGRVEANEARKALVKLIGK